MHEVCDLCPRDCKVNRKIKKGACHVGEELLVARAALHMWEEPCISGEKGSGAIFFSGCSLGCVYCQNREISRGETGKQISVSRLCEIFFELQEKGAANINLVSPDHFIPSVREAILMAKERGFTLPFICNCSGYEKVSSLKLLEGLIDVYLADFKYICGDTAENYSKAPDYPEVAKAAVAEMLRQTGDCVFDGNGMIQKGVIVRHLLLPGNVKEAKQVVKYLYETHGNHIYLSLMNQYTPMADERKFPQLSRKVTKREYERWIDYVLELGVEQAYFQEGDTAGESFVPAFDMEGV